MTSNVVQFPRKFNYYALIPIRGEQRLARYNGEIWEIDRTAALVNEMLQNGLVDADSVQAWIVHHLPSDVDLPPMPGKKITKKLKKPNLAT